jgi:hypothetical protein
MRSTICVLRPVSDAAKKWVKEHVEHEDYQQVSGGIVVERRYIGPITEAMEQAGLVRGKDFEVEG